MWKNILLIRLGCAIYLGIYGYNIFFTTIEYDFNLLKSFFLYE